MKRISDKALEDFNRLYNATSEGVKGISWWIKKFRDWLNELVDCPECKGKVERTRRDDKGDLNLTCPTCYREGKIPRYRLYIEEK